MNRNPMEQVIHCHACLISRAPYGDNGIEVIYVHRGAQTRVLVNTQDLSCSPYHQQRFGSLLNAWKLNRGVDHYWFELRAWLLQNFAKVLRSMENGRPVNYILSDYLYPRSTTWSLKIHEGRLTPVKHNSTLPVQPSLEGCTISHELVSHLQVFHPSALRVWQVPDREFLSYFPHVVIHHDSAKFWLKPIWGSGNAEAIEREILMHRWITEDKRRFGRPRESLRVPSLIGVVRASNGRMLGLLFQFLDFGNMNLLARLEKGNVRPQLLEKWSKQISESIQELHSSNLVWGAATPDNILIDDSDNCWILDFAGWKPGQYRTSQNPETIQADLDGLQDILALLDDSTGHQQGPADPQEKTGGKTHSEEQTKIRHQASTLKSGDRGRVHQSDIAGLGRAPANFSQQHLETQVADCSDIKNAGESTPYPTPPLQNSSVAISSERDTGNIQLCTSIVTPDSRCLAPRSDTDHRLGAKQKILSYENSALAFSNGNPALAASTSDTGHKRTREASSNGLPNVYASPQPCFIRSSRLMTPEETCQPTKRRKLATMPNTANERPEGDHPTMPCQGSGGSHDSSGCQIYQHPVSDARSKTSEGIKAPEGEVEASNKPNWPTVNISIQRN